MTDKLSWIAVYPEIVLLVMACAILLIDLGVKSRQRTLTYVLTLVTLGFVALLHPETSTRTAARHSIRGERRRNGMVAFLGNGTTRASA